MAVQTGAVDGVADASKCFQASGGVFPVVEKLADCPLDLERVIGWQFDLHGDSVLIVRLDRTPG